MAFSVDVVKALYINCKQFTILKLTVNQQVINLTKSDVHSFDKLKKAVATAFLKHHSAPNTVEDWKGEEIVLFQEDLFNKVKAKVSEKWFYTYFKKDSGKLPRIDMLNLLSQYVGHENWYAFKEEALEAKDKPYKKWAWYTSLPILLVIFIVLGLNKKNEFQFCFVDDVKNQAITDISLDIKVLHDNESPVYFKTDSSGCFIYRTTEDDVKFVVQSPYHKTDTITRSINSNNNKTVKLISDDYALMLYYYSNGNVKDWKAHKANLNRLIANDAEIYQLFDQSIGVEIFTKDEFIRLLTIPTQNLKRIEILDKIVEEGRVVKLKFIIR